VNLSNFVTRVPSLSLEIVGDKDSQRYLESENATNIQRTDGTHVLRFKVISIIFGKSIFAGACELSEANA